jgi:hypothetical protein
MIGSAGRLIPVPRRARPPALVILLLAVTTIAACGGAGEGEQAAAAPPAGFATYQAPRFSIAYPGSWTVSERPNPKGSGPPILLIQGASGSGGFSPQIAVGHDTTYPSDFDDAMEIFRLVSIGKAGTVVSDQPTMLAGAARAQRTEYTEPLPGTDGRQYTIRIVEIHALTPARTMYDVLVRAPMEDFDRALLLQALDTFRVK